MTKSAGLRCTTWYYVALELSTPESIDVATYTLIVCNDYGENNASHELNVDGEYDL